ncbi:hypothetical protein BDN72DRAFT_959412 [Pluteus cervinus]|uniref:Uncharacterized protein n=1 Tax=Pluteus cervinus TaxID=181527 RepID=A0ACD3AV58_9AGAR|nr:hypothetical protein BDN72DRAFT_959412 [Pluteus cervinus]
MEFRDQVTLNLSAAQVHNTQYIQNTYSPAPHDDDPLKLLRNKYASTASFDSAGRCATLQCHEETRRVIKKDLTAWVDSGAVAGPNLKWIEGSVGVGKSAVAKWIAEECMKKGQLAASFFFFRGNPDANHIANFIPTIAYQIAVSLVHPIARNFIIAHIKNDPTILTKSLVVQWERLIIKPLVSIRRPVLIVIDGIDEIASADEQCTLLRCILNTPLANPFIRILLISRPEPQIRQEFDTFGLSKTSRISLGASPEDETDLGTFLTLSLNQVHKRRQQDGTMTRVPAPWPSPYILYQLLCMADRQFVYATTLIAFIDDKNDDPVTKLNLVLRRTHAHGNLDHLYLMVMQQAKDETPKLHQQLHRNLLTHALCHAIAANPHLPPLAIFWSTDEALIKIALRRLDLVLIHETPPARFREGITFRHRSFVDFMFNPSFPHPFVVGPASFTVLAHRSLDLLGDPPPIPDDEWSTFGLDYCCSSLPTPQLVFRLATVGLRPFLLLRLFGFELADGDHGHYHAKDMLGYISIPELRQWMQSRPCLSMWLESLLSLELVENSAYEMLCRYPDQTTTNLVQQLVTSKRDPQECRLLLNKRLEESSNGYYSFDSNLMLDCLKGPQASRPLQLDQSPEIRTWLNSLKQAARPTDGRHHGGDAFHGGPRGGPRGVHGLRDDPHRVHGHRAHGHRAHDHGHGRGRDDHRARHGHGRCPHRFHDDDVCRRHRHHNPHVRVRHVHRGGGHRRDARHGDRGGGVDNGHGVHGGLRLRGGLRDDHRLRGED